jgi:hypothetical protein
MKKTNIIIFILLILLVSFVSATGECKLDNYEYHPSETATFRCFCDTPQEENRAGFIVFKNSTGDILQSNAVNSGSCRTIFLFDSFTFPVGANYTGTVIFSLNADGTGTPAQWGDLDDIINDTFIVDPANIYDCRITDIVGSNTALGELNSVKFKVLDSIDNIPLINVYCQADGYTIDNKPLMFEPYGVGLSGRYTGTHGEVGFQHLMTESFWEPGASYRYEFHCNTNPNSSLHPTSYYEDNGDVTGFYSCTANQIFMTSNNDERLTTPIKESLTFVLVFIMIIVWYVAMGILQKKSFLMKFGSFAMALIQFTILLFVTWMISSGMDITGWLFFNFLINLILLFYFSFKTLFQFTLGLMDITGTNKLTIEDKEKDWNMGGFNGK